MSTILERLRPLVGTELAVRDGPIDDVLAPLGVHPSKVFTDFYATYAGPSGSNRIPYELSDLVEGNQSAVASTRAARDRLVLPRRYLVLTPIYAGAALPYDTESAAKFEVAFDSDFENLIDGTALPRWARFEDFLVDFFLGADAQEHASPLRARGTLVA